MKKVLLIAFITIIGNSLFAQKTISTNRTAQYNCEEIGMINLSGEYKLTAKYDEKELGFKTRDEQIMKKFSTMKTTEKHVIGQDSKGNYGFLTIEKKQFYYIDYFMNSYTAFGFGSQSTEIKQNTLKIMDILKKGESQKDVIQYLIRRTECGF